MPATPPAVLIIDDDVDVVSALAAALHREGYRVLTASDGNGGLALAERERPPLVVVDLMMPLKSGLLVLETLKGWPASPRVIMITGCEVTRHQAYAEQLGVDAYLRKPFSLDQFLACVIRLCPLAQEAGIEQGR